MFVCTMYIWNIICMYVCLHVRLCVQVHVSVCIFGEEGGSF